MNMLYTTREGRTWIVTDCAELPLHPGFYLGFRHTDGQQVLVHEHRCKQLPPPVEPKETQQTTKEEA